MPNLMKPMLAAALSLGFAGPVFAADADTVVATVGGEDITLGHMIVMTTQLPQDYQALPDDVLYQAVLDQLIRQAAVAQTIENSLSRESLLALENQRRSFLAGEALNAIAREAVTDEAITSAYETEFSSAEPENELNASHILVETEDEAAAIRAELEAGADFAALAKEKSTGPSGPSGGELGWFRKGMMVAPFEEAALALEVGQVSGPVQTQFGWHIVKLNDKRTLEAPALDEVRTELAEALQEEAIAAAIDELTAGANVTRTEEEIDPAMLRNMELLKD